LRGRRRDWQRGRTNRDRIRPRTQGHVERARLRGRAVVFGRVGTGDLVWVDQRSRHLVLAERESSAARVEALVERDVEARRLRSATLDQEGLVERRRLKHEEPFAAEVAAALGDGGVDRARITPRDAV